VLVVLMDVQAVAAVTAFGAEIRDLVVNVSAGATGLSADDLSKQLPQLQGAGSAASSSSGEGFAILPWLQLWATLASLYYTDMAIKGVLTQYAIKFPSALVGMFGVFGLLCAVGDNMANKILAFYGPALNWIARWLPIFYVPALVTLPLALQGIPGALTSGLLWVSSTSAGLWLHLPRPQMMSLHLLVHVSSMCAC
jgi:hypothetical protein